VEMVVLAHQGGGEKLKAGGDQVAQLTPLSANPFQTRIAGPID